MSQSWSGFCAERGDARGGGWGRDRPLRLPAVARPAGSMLSPRIRQARRGECAFPCGSRCAEGTVCRHGEKCRPWRRPSTPARWSPELRPPPGRTRLLPPWPKPALGRAAGVSGACEGSERMKQGGDLCLCSPTSSAVSGQSSRDNSKTVLHSGLDGAFATLGWLLMLCFWCRNSL